MTEKINLFCLPYAGGSASYYYKWRNYLGDSIQLFPLELAGRGKRFQEPLYQSLEEAVEDLYILIQNKLTDTSFAFFGHSMGSLLAYALSIKIKKNNKLTPLHLFFSGRLAPHIEYSKITTLPEEQFMARIIKLGGISKDLIQNRDLYKVFFPIIKSDYKMTESYSVLQTIEKLNCDISILYGIDDPMTAGNIDEWEQYTNGKCSFYSFTGGHFFVLDNFKKVIQIINQTLC